MMDCNADEGCNVAEYYISRFLIAERIEDIELCLAGGGICS
jgi:hypothetical protein